MGEVINLWVRRQERLRDTVAPGDALLVCAMCESPFMTISRPRDQHGLVRVNCLECDAHVMTFMGT